MPLFISFLVVNVFPFSTTPLFPCFPETQGLWITCLSIREPTPSGSSRLFPCPPQAFLLGWSMERTTCLKGSQRDRTSWPGGQTACSTWGRSQRLVRGKTLLKKRKKNNFVLHWMRVCWAQIEDICTLLSAPFHSSLNIFLHSSSSYEDLMLLRS